MIKSFYRLIDMRMVVLLIIMLIISPTLGGKNTYTICLVYSHYLTVYMNNVYLLMIYQYASYINQLSSFMITRIQEKYYYLYSYISLISMGLIYHLIIFISYYFFFGAIEKESLFVTVLYMIFTLIMNAFESTIIYLQIGQKKNFLYLALPILMNFLFHILYAHFF